MAFCEHSALFIGVNKSLGKCNQTEKSPIVEKKILKSLDFLPNPKIITSTMLVKERTWERLSSPCYGGVLFGSVKFYIQVKISKNNENGRKNRH